MPSAILIDDAPVRRAQLRKLLVGAGFSVVAKAARAAAAGPGDPPPRTTASAQPGELAR
jgi:CheY-like chemotaxis protein